MDSLVTDLMFRGGVPLDQKVLLEALGGETEVARKKILDPDMLDPRVEMELSPSMPFRRRGERRLMLIDDSVAPLRADPQNDPVIAKDLRPFKEALIELCQKLPIRLGRLFALGSWGDAVLVARSAVDLRAICLLPWVLDPQIDVDGKPRASRISPQEFEAKLAAFEKRLEELDEKEILARLSGVSFERRGELLVVDVLDDKGHWDQRTSMILEKQLAALDRFSLFPGAPSSQPVAPPVRASVPAPAPTAAPIPEPAGPPLTVAEVDGRLMLMFPAERFNLDVAAALGKKDWGTVLRRSDPLTGAQRDRVHRDGATWIAPLEFLSEVFVDGKPLTKPAFEQASRTVGAGRALDVHFPRFGPAAIIDLPGAGRFVTSHTENLEAVIQTLGREGGR